MGVYLPTTVDDYSAMQGPAPDGFHVPSKDEWTSVYNIWQSLGGGRQDYQGFSEALKLPLAGIRSPSNSNASSQGSIGSYWSCTCYESIYQSYRMRIQSGGLTPGAYSSRGGGSSIRCFKNIVITPELSWTKLYGTSIEAGGIFWNSVLGLISLSSDGTTWITIADKNLGATTVWNSGDTLSEANCGKYYQWGNNYGFAWTGTLADTSTTQVDATNYGPGNYYSSSTFIKSGDYNGWDSSDNKNLWGGVKEVKPTDLKNAYIGSTPVKRIMMRPNGVEKQVRPSRLPNEYQEVEYIQSSGSGNSGQYIDIGFTFSGNNGNVYIEYTPLSLGNQYYTCRTSGSYNGTNRAINIYGLYSPFYFGIGRNDINSSLSMSINTKYTVNLTANNGNYSLDFNGQTSTGTYSGTIANNRTIAVFCSHEDEGAIYKYNYMASMKLYSYKIYDNGTLARDLIPCYRKADTEIGMYDLVNDQFYTNAGTGTFTKGPDV